MWWLRNFFQWDHKIITEERVLRIPWFDHCKTLEDKYETTYRPLSWKQYTEEEMLKAFPDTTNKKEQEKKEKERKKKEIKRSGKIKNDIKKKIWKVYVLKTEKKEKK